ncbi:SLC13 family permease [uncultured Mailhella sp.]|uniref:SLC13 family permease n=1 Tax=uncultured Mailhella sp. TaxID=1981031 RepID=UPI0025E2DCB5|nr:SLC13 family permease [uncultured Mailhella sp.]
MELLKSKGIRWAVCLLCAITATFLLQSESSSGITLYWFGTIFAIGIFAFDLLPTFVTAFLLLIFYILTGVSTPDTVFSGFLSPIPWMCLSGMLIGVLMERNGLASRIALFTVSRIGTTPIRLYLAFLSAGYLVSAIIPDTITVTIVFMAIASGICHSLNLPQHSRAASTLILAAFFGSNISSASFLPNNIGLPGLIMVKDMGVTFSWLGFLMENLPYELLNALVSFTILHFFGSRELGRYISEFRNSATRELESLGSMSFGEKKTLLLALLALLAFTTESLHGLPGYYAFCAVVLLGFTPLFNLLSTDDLKEVQFPILFFIVGCMAIGTVAGELGLPALLAQNLQPVLEQFKSGPLVSLFAYWTGILANMVLTPIAAATSLSVPMGEIASSLGLTIKPVLYSFLYGLDQFILPYELTPALLMFATGYVRIKDLLVVMPLRMLGTSVAVVIVAAFIWPALGI